MIYISLPAPLKYNIKLSNLIVRLYSVYTKICNYVNKKMDELFPKKFSLHEAKISEKVYKSRFSMSYNPMQKNGCECLRTYVGVYGKINDVLT